MKKSITVLLLMRLLLLGACADPDHDTAENTVEGAWVAPVYGLALSITPTEYSYYQYTAQTCQLFLSIEETYSDTVDNFGLTADSQTMLNRFFGAKQPAVRFDRQAALPDNCTSSLLVNRGKPGFIPDDKRAPALSADKA